MDMTVEEFLLLQAEVGQTPSILMRQIMEHAVKKHIARSVLIRQVNERAADLEACEEIADTMTNATWGMF